jgi:BirA family biotin operon repressor/biotin-[acetyl-CoA-carboxylase] ligase
LRRRPSLQTGELIGIPVVTSTMDEARALVLEGRTGVIGVRAGHQTSGRGRQKARWTDRPGHSLLVTYILRGLEGMPSCRLAFAAGVAVADAARKVAGVQCGLKWPNDVVVDGAKLAGVLVETLQTDDGACALVGIGLNVNQTEHPPDLGDATSLRRAAGRTFDIEQVERAVRSALQHCLRLDWPDLLARWRELDATTGRIYRAVVDGGTVVGAAVGVDDEGALQLQLRDGAIVATWSATTDHARG